MGVLNIFLLVLMFLSGVLTVILVQLLQELGTVIVRRTDKRITK